MFNYLKALMVTKVSQSEKGQDLAEYGLLVGVIALIVIVGATLFGNNLLAFFNNLAGTVAGW
jgi:pilus assembly protein Flp/PilA